MVVRKLAREQLPSLEDIIDRGGEVAADKSKDESKEWLRFNMRLRKDMSEDIDKLLENRVGIPKTGWILEAIQAHLKIHNNS